eukprot:gene39998-49446_t
MLGAGQLMAAVAALAVAGVVLLLYQVLSLHQALVGETRVQAAIVADNLAAPLMFRDRDAAADALRALRSAPYFHWVAIYDQQGLLFEYYGVNGHVPVAERRTLDWLHSARETAPIEYRGKQLGKVVLAHGTGGIREALAHYLGLVILASFGALLLAQLLARRTRARVVAAERELDYLAHTDQVTALPNRRALAALTAALAAASGRTARIARPWLGNWSTGSAPLPIWLSI